MESIDSARAAILECAAPLAAEEVPLEIAAGRVLAAEVRASHDVPPFANSAMDGFAIVAPGGDLEIVGESRAGAPYEGTLASGEAIRISTGAALPEGADAVVQIERAVESDDRVQAEAEPGTNVRGAGEDLRAGGVALAAGTRLGAAELGVAASAGHASLRCARRPRVAIVATGDELVPPGQPLGPGQIHDSNALALETLARHDGAEVVASLRAGDSRRATSHALADALSGADVVLISGGVSVGPHDHVKPALEALGARERFWRVALRPGKPMWFGTSGATLVFGLPGNPVSVIVTYVLFARPAIAALQGAGNPAPRRRVPLAHPVARHPDRDEAARVELDLDGGAHLTGPQGSHVLSSMLGADGLAIVPRGDGELEAGTLVELEPL